MLKARASKTLLTKLFGTKVVFNVDVPQLSTVNNEDVNKIVSNIKSGYLMIEGNPFFFIWNKQQLLLKVY
jgi:hypothetical protein